MKPAKSVEEVELNPSEQDLEMMSIVDNAFSMCPSISMSIKSLNDEIAPIIEDMVDSQKAFPTMNETFRNLNRQPQGGRVMANQVVTADKMFAAMLITSLKEKSSTQGSSNPVFMEEVEWMLRNTSHEEMLKIERCVTGAS